MAYRIRIYASPTDDQETLQVFGNNMCPEEFKRWAKTHLGRDLNESNDWAFGGYDEDYRPLPIEDIHSFLECVDLYTQHYINRHIDDGHLVEDEIRYAKADWETQPPPPPPIIPMEELPAMHFAMQIYQSEVFCSFNLWLWLLYQGIIEFDWQAELYKYMPGKKIWIAGY